MALLFFVPFFWSVSTSLKSLPESVAGFDLIPDNPSLRAYREVWTQFNFARFAANSAFFAVTITITNVLLASIGGYAFARLRFPGREALFMLVLATLMIPDQLRLVPVFQMLTNWSLIGTYQGYVLVKLVLAESLFLMRQYFLTIPRDFEEAAKLDGAGYFKTYWRVMLPLATPAIAAVTILTFQGIWNELFWPLIILQDESKYTLTIGISQFVGIYNTQWPELMAASVIAILPVAMIFLVFQRYFVSGIVAARGEGMTRALGAALRGMWAQSWRLFLANAALSAGVLPFLVAALWAPLALVGAALVAGPLAMALMHCAVELVREDELSLRVWLTGLRLHWRRGFALGGACALVRRRRRARDRHVRGHGPDGRSLLSSSTCSSPSACTSSRSGRLPWPSAARRSGRWRALPPTSSCARRWQRRCSRSRCCS